MDKTIALQTSLILIVFFGITNVIQTELAGNGLMSAFQPDKLAGHRVAKEQELTFTGNKRSVIQLNATIRKRPGRTEFKYFTIRDGIWIESRYP